MALSHGNSSSSSSNNNSDNSGIHQWRRRRRRWPVGIAVESSLLPSRFRKLASERSQTHTHSR